MKKSLAKNKIWPRLGAFLLVLCIFGTLLHHIIIPKFYRSNALPPSVSYPEFYRMDRNSVDVLFLGSSHAFSSYDTQEMYNKYGITSFNLGSGDQNLLLSYYWLCEALRYQKPEAVVVDCAYLFRLNFDSGTVPNFSGNRSGLVYMRWSPVKWKAVLDVCSIDSSQTVQSYVFPIIRFHDRWKELESEDFRYGEITGTDHLKGFCETYTARGGSDYTPFHEGDNEDREDMLELQEQYLDRITSLCKEEGIQLVLTLTPYQSETIEKHNSVKDYAQENDLPFIDFGEASVYDAMKYDFSQDHADTHHANPGGAVKITDYLGAYLQNAVGLKAHTDEQYEKSRDYYQTFMELAGLVRTDESQSYVEGLRNNRAAAFVYVKNMDSLNTPEEVREVLSELGLQADFLSENSQAVRAAVIENGKVQKTFSDLKEKVDSGDAKGVLENGTDQYRLTYETVSGNVRGGFSVNNETANLSNGNTVTYDKELHDGVTILVYDEVMAREVDKVHLSGDVVER